MNKELKGNLAMAVSRVFSGINVNALKFLLPLWIGSFTGVMFRYLVAGSLFWITGLFVKEDKASWKDRIKLMALGAFCLYINMATYLVGITMTTPVSAAIFNALQPIIVFVAAMFTFGEKLTKMKFFGIVLGFAGAIVCIATQKSNEMATNPLLGNILCFISSAAYAFFLILGKELLERIGDITVLKWSFTGAAIPAIISVLIAGFDAPLLVDMVHGHFHWFPFCVFIFVLIFPTFFTYILTPIGLNCLNTVVVSLYSYVILVVATICSYIFGQDKFNVWQAVAFVMICFSIYFLEIAEKKKQLTPNNAPPEGLTMKLEALFRREKKLRNS